MSSHSVFIKCNSCNIKPATIKCFNCRPLDQGTLKICYQCDSRTHSQIEKANHKKEIIPYQQMYVQPSEHGIRRELSPNNSIITSPSRYNNRPKGSRSPSRYSLYSNSKQKRGYNQNQSNNYEHRPPSTQASQYRSRHAKKYGLETDRLQDYSLSHIRNSNQKFKEEQKQDLIKRINAFENRIQNSPGRFTSPLRDTAQLRSNISPSRLNIEQSRYLSPNAYRTRSNQYSMQQDNYNVRSQYQQQEYLTSPYRSTIKNHSPNRIQSASEQYTLNLLDQQKQKTQLLADQLYQNQNQNSQYLSPSQNRYISPITSQNFSKQMPKRSYENGLDIQSISDKQQDISEIKQNETFKVDQNQNQQIQELQNLLQQESNEKKQLQQQLEILRQKVESNENINDIKKYDSKIEETYQLQIQALQESLDVEKKKNQTLMEQCEKYKVTFEEQNQTMNQSLEQLKQNYENKLLEFEQMLNEQKKNENEQQQNQSEKEIDQETLLLAIQNNPNILNTLKEAFENEEIDQLEQKFLQNQEQTETKYKSLEKLLQRKDEIISEQEKEVLSSDNERLTKELGKFKQLFQEHVHLFGQQEEEDEEEEESQENGNHNDQNNDEEEYEEYDEQEQYEDDQHLQDESGEQ